MGRVSRLVERLSISERGLVEGLPTPKREKVVALHRGDPSFNTPEYIVEAALRAMKDGYTHYPVRQGDPDLREAIADYQNRISGVPVSPKEVLVTNGGTGAVSEAMMAHVDPGDEVIVFDPGYALFADAARMVGAEVVIVPMTADFGVDVDAVRRAVTPRTRMLVLNFPTNPTGRLLRKDELDGLADVAARNDLLVLSDEVYDQLVFKGQHISALGHPLLRDRTILVNSFSKTYAMTGWRVGWIVAKADLLPPIVVVSRSAQGHVNTIAQRAALTALTDGESDRQWRAWMLGQYQSRRKLMWEGLAVVPGVQLHEPEAAFYAWVKYDAPLSSVEMTKYLYENGLNIRPGTEFGEAGEKHLRFTFAASESTIAEGVELFKAAMMELRGA